MPSSTQFENNLSQKQFETFLLIYAAHVDFEFSDSERKFILSRTDSKTFESMLDLYLKNGDYSCLKILLNHKSKYYQSKEDQDSIFQLLVEIFKVDGDYSRIEKSFIDFFKKVIHSEWI